MNVSRFFKTPKHLLYLLNRVFRAHSGFQVCRRAAPTVRAIDALNALAVSGISHATLTSDST